MKTKSWPSILSSIALSTLISTTALAKFNKGEEIQLDTSWITGAVLTEAEALTKTLKRDIMVYSWVDREHIAGFEKGQVDVNNSENININRCVG